MDRTCSSDLFFQLRLQRKQIFTGCVEKYNPLLHAKHSGMCMFVWKEDRKPSSANVCTRSDLSCARFAQHLFANAVKFTSVCVHVTARS